MKKNDIILTVAIPSYNRVEQIQKQIRLLLPQLRTDVRLIVLDNCSPIFIDSLFSETELELFSVIRNVTNIGADANIARCFELCTTKWLWTLGDDDFVKPDAINNILDIIRQNEDATWLNFATSEDTVLCGFHDFSNNLNSFSSFSDSFWMSKCVYNLDELKGSLYWYYKNISAMIGTLIMLLKYSINKPKKKFVRLRTKLFETDSTDISWSHYDYIRYAGILFDSFSQNEKKILRNNLLKVLTKIHLCMLRYDMEDTKYMFRVVIARYGLLNSLISFPIEFFRGLFMISFPSLALKYIIKMKILLTKQT